jgi:dTDP-glucose pyrophosphorylase
VNPARFEKIFVGPGATVREAVEAIDAGAIEIALVADDERRLVGTVTDGDVRRALLAGTGLDEPVAPIAHAEPVTAEDGTSEDLLLALMTERSVEQIPLLRDGRVVDVAFIRELVSSSQAEGPVVLMAGGPGERLRPLTEETPKPMLPVADRPLLETVLAQVREAGFQRVLMAVNYRAEVIESHFGDGREFGVEIDYVREPERLGSAGALQLVREQLDRPFVVMNADLLTKVNLGALLRFHVAEGNVLTLAVRRYELEVPYGVVDIEGARVQGLREKPSLGFFVNAGIYAVSPAAVDLLPASLREFQMTDLIEAALAAGAPVGSFAIREYWLDIGQLGDYERAHEDHATYFGRS